MAADDPYQAHLRQVRLRHEHHAVASLVLTLRLPSVYRVADTLDLMSPSRDHQGRDHQGADPAARISTQRAREALEHAAEVVEDWLDAQDIDAPEMVTRDEDALWRVNALALAGAPEAVLDDAVCSARQSGWGWSPIAMLLGETPRRTQRRVR